MYIKFECIAFSLLGVANTNVFLGVDLYIPLLFWFFSFHVSLLPLCFCKKINRLIYVNRYFSNGWMYQTVLTLCKQFLKDWGAYSLWHSRGGWGMASYRVTMAHWKNQGFCPICPVRAWRRARTSLLAGMVTVISCLVISGQTHLLQMRSWNC